MKLNTINRCRILPTSALDDEMVHTFYWLRLSTTFDSFNFKWLEDLSSKNNIFSFH